MRFALEGSAHRVEEYPVGGEPSRCLRVTHVMTVAESLAFIDGQPEFMRRHDVHLSAITSADERLTRFGISHGIPVRGVSMHRQISPLSDLRAIYSLCAQLRALRPDIVHAHTPKGGLLGMIASRISRVPIRIYHIRGLPLMTATGFRRALLWSAEWVACRLATRVLCVSASVRQEAINRRLVPELKIAVLGNGSGNGVDATSRFSAELYPSLETTRLRASLGIPADAVVVGFVGRLVRDKGITELATAWQVLRERHPHVWLLLVGPPEPQDPIPRHVEQMLRDDPRVSRTGRVASSAQFYAAMDILVLPTYREGFPNVVLEASAMALPVVATAVPGCVDAVRPGESGTLVPPFDSQALAEAIEGYISDAELRAAHGNWGRRFVLESFSQQAVWTALLKEYHRLARIFGVTTSAYIAHGERRVHRELPPRPNA